MSEHDTKTMETVESVDETQELQNQLVAEDLIEEVSIDGMCGVY